MNEILQIGEGSFLRAFAEYYIQLAADNGNFSGSVNICQPRKNTSVINALKEQNCKYSVLLKGKLSGKTVNEVKRINCVSSCIDTCGEYDRLIELFCGGELQIVISNTTEAGICFDENDRLECSPNISFPGKLTALLYERFNAEREPLIFLPVELIENNGEALKNCIISYARLWDLGDDFITFINCCSFCNTLVDRIVTGKTEFENDNCAVACEPYGSWLISADSAAENKLKRLFDGVEDIAFVNDLSLYRQRKVKILNGAHTMSVFAAYNMGYKIVRHMLNDELINKYIKKGLYEEIIPTIPLPVEELNSFADSVLERFDNPFIDHRLLDISLNSASKFKARCLCSINDYMKLFGKAPEALSFALAALIYSYYIKPNDFQINDSQDVKNFFEQEHNDIVFDCLAQKAFWGEDLTENSLLLQQVKKHYNNICEYKTEKAMEILCNE
ncbi:MAG: tagaturonate reductase [Eubacterium sp.]